MNKIFLALAVAFLTLNSCKKNERATENQAVETDLAQPEAILKAENGSQMKVIYFADGKEVAVKLTKDTEPRRILHAKGTSNKGNPVFTDGKIAWEMSQDGTSGTLLENGNSTVYKK